MLTAAVGPTHTADVCDSWLRWPTATSAERWLAARSVGRPGAVRETPPPRPAVAGRALGSRHRSWLKRAPRVRTGLDAAVPAERRWLAASAALDRPAPTRALLCAGGRRVRLTLLVADDRALVRAELPSHPPIVFEGGQEIAARGGGAYPPEVEIVAASWQAALSEEVSRVRRRR